MLGGERLNALYGLTLDEPNLPILMRHRAVLFGLVSVLSFLLLAWNEPVYDEAFRRVVIADWSALACLLLALGLHRRQVASTP